MDKSYEMTFVSYDGRFPCLCGGTLVLLINGEKHYFGSGFKHYDDTHHHTFWESGGWIDEEYDDHEGPWIIEKGRLPEQFRKYASQIDRLFNENVEHGCCGGCI